MRIVIVGASGTVGTAVRNELADRHEIISAGRGGSDVVVDITSTESIKRMYRDVGKVDAVISATGRTYFGSLAELTPENNEVSIESKLRGQINLVLLGLDYLNDRGSFTLTTGIVMDEPILGGASAAMANGAIAAFVKTAALDMPRGIRINNVSPNVLEESSAKYESYFPGFGTVSSGKVALAFRKSVEGGQTGQTYRVY